MSLPSLRPITHHRTMHFPHGSLNVIAQSPSTCPYSSLTTRRPFPPSPSNPISYSSIECVINQTTVASCRPPKPRTNDALFSCLFSRFFPVLPKGGCDLRGYEWGSLLKHSPSPFPSLSTAQFLKLHTTDRLPARCPIHSPPPLSQQTRVFFLSYLAR